jgi:hypothetical protein
MTMTIARLLRTAIPKTAITGAIAMGLTLSCANPSFAGNREKAWHIYQRLTGTPPTNAVLDTMTACISGNTSVCSAGGGDTTLQGTPVASAGEVQAAYLAMQDKNFLNVKVKNMVIPWTNKDQTVFFPFNDAAALLIGLIGSGQDFRQALYADIYYDDPSVPAAFQFTPFVFPSTTLSPQSNNNHFEYIEHNDLPLKTALVQTKQTGVTGMPAEGVAGVMTTRAMQRAFFYAGTNRAMLRFTFMNFLCNDFVQIKDITSNPDRIRQDPSRSPGGDSSVFLNNCIGCHAGMDGLAGAFAYYNWGPAVYDSTIEPDTQGSVYASSANPLFTLSGKDIPPTRVMPKYLQNFLDFPYGHETQDDSWINYWRVGLDANLGWANNTTPHVISYDPPNSNPYPSEPGNSNMGSAAQLGYELANTEAFARCQVLHVYRHTCMNDPSEAAMTQLVGDFKANKYNMLTVFSDAAASCSGN